MINLGSFGDHRYRFNKKIKFHGILDCYILTTVHLVVSSYYKIRQTIFLHLHFHPLPLWYDQPPQDQPKHQNIKHLLSHRAKELHFCLRQTAQKLVSVFSQLSNFILPWSPLQTLYNLLYHFRLNLFSQTSHLPAPLIWVCRNAFHNLIEFPPLITDRLRQYQFL